uniref:Uncharacterized protein n=1 Tax=Cucumis melo TaxID=3656 RepID=A0A9I9ELL7_CUCME
MRRERIPGGGMADGYVTPPLGSPTLDPRDGVKSTTNVPLE